MNGSRDVESKSWDLSGISSVSLVSKTKVIWKYSGRLDSPCVEFSQDVSFVMMTSNLIPRITQLASYMIGVE